MGVVAEIVLWLDLGSKYWVRNHLNVGEARELFGGEMSLFLLTNIPNPGSALGFFQNGNMFITYFGILVVIGLLVFDFLRKRKIDLGRFGLALLLGGILGNLIDRLVFGYVTDIFMFLSLPVFNIADVCIAVGIIYLIIDLIIKERNNYKNH